jgi:hypothetical protein
MFKPEIPFPSLFPCFSYPFSHLPCSIHAHLPILTRPQVLTCQGSLAGHVCLSIESITGSMYSMRLGIVVINTTTPRHVWQHLYGILTRKDAE